MRYEGHGAGCPTHRARCDVWVLTPPKCVQFDTQSLPFDFCSYPVRFLPSTITFRKIRLIRVW